MNIHDELDFASRIIRRIATRMIGKTGLVEADIPDLQQDLWLELLSRVPNFRADRGSPRAFITLVVRNKRASILTERMAAKRGNGVPCLSLDFEQEDDDGVPVAFHETISVDDYLQRTRGTIRSEKDRRDLALDVRKVVAKLPSHDRVVCLLLIDRDVCDIAKVIGLPRSTLRDLIKKLRIICDQAEFKKYFE